MGFRKIETLHCLIREERVLKLKCQCGHVAEYRTEKALYALIGTIQKRKRNRSTQLSDLRTMLSCGLCQLKDFAIDYEEIRART